jgi:GNAT superfamily N-acetyltransferase
MKIRQANESDIPVVIEMWHACDADETSDAPHLTYPTLANDELLRGELEMAIGSAAGFLAVAEDEKGIAGFIRAQLQYRSIATPSVTLFVDCIYVKPEYRGTNVAANLERALRLWNKAAGQHMKQHVGAAELVCRPTERMIGFWQKRGWKSYGVLMWRPVEEE